MIQQLPTAVKSFEELRMTMDDAFAKLGIVAYATTKPDRPSFIVVVSPSGKTHRIEVQTELYNEVCDLARKATSVVPSAPTAPLYNEKDMAELKKAVESPPLVATPVPDAHLFSKEAIIDAFKSSQQLLAPPISVEEVMEQITEQACRCATGLPVGLNFSHALRLLKNGHALRRTSWDSKMRVRIHFDTSSATILGLTIRTCFVAYYGDGTCRMNHQFSEADLLAEDWLPYEGGS